MATRWENRVRVRPAGLIIRGTAAAIEQAATWTVAVAILAGPDLVLRLIHRVTDRTVHVSSAGTTALRVTAVCVVALISAWWSCGRFGRVRVATGTRVVDATTYASIGLPRALLRFAVRELVWLATIGVTLDWALAHRPSDALRDRLAVAGYLAACRVAPLALAWFLPRRRGLHDLVAHTVVVDLGPASAEPRVEAVMQCRQVVAVAA